MCGAVVVVENIGFRGRCVVRFCTSECTSTSLFFVVFSDLLAAARIRLFPDLTSFLWLGIGSELGGPHSADQTFSYNSAGHMSIV
mmetsp:Transcript_56692/g.64971  ORF Transcript_56692/g.64971 Transcript_56692/m.64971 type:complete len:85 (-) Transcript_56692:78-332(-)